MNIVIKGKSLLPALKAFLVFFAALAVSGVWAAHFIPSFIYLTEQNLGRSLPYEMHMRFYMGGMVLALLAGYLFFILVKKMHARRFIFIFLCAAFLPLLAVLFFDARHSLIEEMSWIRYPSALFLLLAGGALFFISRRYNKGETWPQRNELVYLLLSAAFVFAGFDEIGEFHEKIGYVLEKLFSLAHLTTDLITVGYFAGGVVALVWMTPVFLGEMSDEKKSFMQICFFGLLLFGLATLFDTLDTVVLDGLRKAAASLASRGYSFSDAWYIIYEPKRFLNGLEEIGEYYAAVLFAGAGCWRLLVINHTEPSHLPNASETDNFFGVAIKQLDAPFRLKNCSSLACRAVIPVGIFIGALLLSPFFLPRKDRFSPLEGGTKAIAVASIQDGLFHSDDLAYAPEWGIVLANESEPKRRGVSTGPGVFVYNDDVLARLPDVRRQLRDVDSVAICFPGICASDATDGKIFYYDAEQDLGLLADRTQGLSNPEGLAWHEGVLAILDEGKKTISRFDVPMRQLTEFRPLHRLWQAPEGIAYHPQLKAWLISDDVTGAIFTYRWGESVEIWQNAMPLKAPEDIYVSAEGEVYVTDNGRGELVIFNAEGTAQRTLRFRPLFRDVQGVAVDAEGDVFVVSADSYGSASFMPSYLWKISLNAD
ncbi:MAG: hypothetical protein WC659_06540 [Patescibacteria group bacterium]